MLYVSRIFPPIRKSSFKAQQTCFEIASLVFGFHFKIPVVWLLEFRRGIIYFSSLSLARSFNSQLSFS